jgi:glycosyltransferase involved in cell wall biosynthesis
VKIAFDARYLNLRTSGVGTYCDSVLRALGELEPSLEFLLITREKGLVANLPELRASELVFRPKPRSLRTAYELSLRLRRERFDVFHGPFNLLPSGLRRPSVVTVHDLMQIENPANIAKSRFVQNTAGLFWRTRLRHAVEHATRVVTVSEATRDTLFEYFPKVTEERVVAAPLGVNPYFFESPTPEQLELVTQRIGPGPFVLNVGNESPHKNHARAIQAFVEAFKDRPELRFVIVRRMVRHDRELLELLERPDVASRVVLLDYTELPMLRALYKLARVFFFPSWVEGFGIPVLEAMAMGTVVVTSNRSALREVAGDAAVTMSPFSVTEMASALRRAEADESLRHDLVDRGLRRARQFTWKQCAETTLKVYEAARRSGT